ncbi:DUF3006 domain-containing protein [Eubacteriales bacterium OttesenSCG-928-M02]|nr:DUF3006 domain-containing protein [Eubacteriales bacterium OttesenSCG-928-M02]
MDVYILDRIEEDHAVLVMESSGQSLRVPLSHLPLPHHEGAVFQKGPDGFSPNPQLEENLRSRSRSRLNALFQRPANDES